jgi:DNA-binding XRE family transcriptional regulator
MRADTHPTAAPDDFRSSVEGHLRQLLATTDGLLETLKQLEADNRKNGFVRRAREQQPEALTKGDTSYPPDMHESARISRDFHALADEVRPGLLRRVWSLFPDLEIDFPGTRGAEHKYRELLENIPEGHNETGWVRQFLLGLNTLLRDALNEVSRASRQGSGAGAETAGPSSESSIGNQLREKRVMRGHKQETVAEKLGCDVSTISRIERGKQHPQGHMEANIKKYLSDS